MYSEAWGAVGSIDFVQYWAAAKVVRGGGNPYDPVAVLAVKEAAGWPGQEPWQMFYPPWTLALVLPFSLLPFGTATLVWLLVQLLLILASGVLLWLYFAPDDGRYWIGPVLAVAFVPGLFALNFGQISPWFLAGVVGFLWAERKGWDLLAGAALALLAIKPHYVYLFLLAALWWIWRSRRWRIVPGFLGLLLAASLLVLLYAPDAFFAYPQALSEPPTYWASPVLGTWLRLILGYDREWLQFLPSLAGVLGLVIWLWRRRGPWRWERVAPPLLLACALTASYGWEYDQLVLLPVVIALVSQMRSASVLRRAIVFGVLIASQLALVVQSRLHMSAAYVAWHPWLLAGLYLWGTAHTRRDSGDLSAGGES
jgi:hypothetical protein